MTQNGFAWTTTHGIEHPELVTLSSDTAIFNAIPINRDEPETRHYSYGWECLFKNNDACVAR